MYILDTDHVSLWLEDHPMVKSKAAEFEAELAITIVTVQQLFNGWVGRLNLRMRAYRNCEERVYTYAIAMIDINEILSRSKNRFWLG